MPSSPPKINQGLDGFSRLIATFFYLGYIPVAPGTMGALGGVVFYLLLDIAFPGFIPARWADLSWNYMVFLLVFFGVGVMVAHRMEKASGKKDAPEIVVDEAFSIFITMFLIPFSAGALIVGFILNRLFDIRKPFPAGLAEEIPGGWGIMLDDLVAAVYSNLFLRLILFLTR